MLLSVRNKNMSISVDTRGAQLMELTDVAGVQYLWQGDPRYWVNRSPLLFPFIGRLTNDVYRIGQKHYAMRIHGFASSHEFAVESYSDQSLTLRLDSNSVTRAQYPFDFSLYLTYTLQRRTLQISYRVVNLGEQIMFFGLGGHPGFRVPMRKGEIFSDYFLEFSKPCQPDQVGFTSEGFLNGVDMPFQLEEDTRLHLQHNLFDQDAIVLKDMARQVSLCSQTFGCCLTVCFPQMPYLGIWHRPKTEAPYVCIEPWSSLPARQGIIEELSCKSDLIHLPGGQSYENTWSITVCEEGAK